MSEFEESFAPEPLDEQEEATPLPPSKRVCVAGPPAETQKRKRTLEKENLTRIIEINWVDDETDDTSSDDGVAENSKLEERIHYLKLNLANAQLEISALKEAQEPLKKNTDALHRFSCAIDIVETNIIEYSNLITLVKSTPFATLIRMEAQRVKVRPDLNLEPLADYAQEVLLRHYNRIQDNEIRARDQFHARIIFEKSKAETIMFLKFAAAFFLLFIIMIATIAYAL
jgi:hypothetical protein